MSDEWISTREVAKRLGYRHMAHLRQKLLDLGIPCRRLTPRSPRRWSWAHIELQFHGAQSHGDAH